MLVDNQEAAGLNSGMMMPQYTAAALVLENRTLASPASIHSLPTSAAQEDHNANAMTAARHTLQVVKNTRHVLAIELYTASRALYLRLRDQPDLKPGKGVLTAYNIIRNQVPYQAGDTLWGPEIEQVRTLLENDQLLSAVKQALDSPDDPDS
jgi:histidine ammonia-lyase